MKKIKAAKAPKPANRGEGRIGFEEWNLNAVDRQQELIKEVIKEGVAIALSEPPWVDIPFTYDGEDGEGGPPVHDQFVIRFTLPLGPIDDDDPTWTFHFGELVENDVIAQLVPDTIANAVKFRDALRALADKIDEAIDKEGKSGA